MVNPTVDDYHFSWKIQSLLSGIEISNFHCTVTEGIAERGKRTDMSFTFLASDIGVFESFWLFSIEKYNLECLFLVVGIVTEPSVYCMIAHVKLKPTILGSTLQSFLTNLLSSFFPSLFISFETEVEIELLIFLLCSEVIFL